MKDKFGTFRGKCMDGCACIEFKANPDGTSVRCSECNHAPIKHESFGVVGACRGCIECKSFEASYGEFAFCEYCECSINLHCPPQYNRVVLSPPPETISTVGQQEDVKSSLQAGIGGIQYQNMGATPFNQTSATELIDSTVSRNPMGQVPINQFGQVPMDQMGQAPMGQMGQVPMGQMGQAPMGQMGQVPMGQMGQAPIGQMGQVPMGQMGQVPMSQTGQAPMGQMGQVPMGQMGQAPMGQMGQVPMSQTGQAPMGQMGQVPMGQMGQAPINQFGQAPMGQMGQAPINQFGQAPMGQMGQVPMNQMGGAQFYPMHQTNQMYQGNNLMFNPNMNQQLIAPQPQQAMQGSNPMKCAIQECDQPPFYDPVNGLQTCCSITHAMEHERRKALGNTIVKGITHCLLPSCNKHVWPFMNYCGRTHADAGKQIGLIPPDPNAGTPSQREVSEGVCALPGCNKPRFVLILIFPKCIQ
ncbi:hypothetical protein LOD99_12841 [Oopsacas minuta]|uniref:Uncharacterized protein n=1 Tax=Oopsacas minuta TaxID=111878 RepID=A0AAV7JDE4_9METZ|nr:hypothetical protein LOD99_12841 [Oopsacas minuta]